MPGQSQSEQWITLNSPPSRPTPSAEDVKPRFVIDMQTVSEAISSGPPMIIITNIKCRGFEDKVCLPDPDQISSRDQFFTQIRFVQILPQPKNILLKLFFLTNSTSATKYFQEVYHLGRL